MNALPSVPGYQIEGVLGRGGMGVVYKALHIALKRTVALKMVLAGGHASAQDLARFKAEAEAVARLQHPNIVQVYEVGAHDGLPFCALEFVDGGSLAQRLHDGPLAPAEAARLVELLASAMHLAHSRNVVHRDLKPANILLQRSEVRSQRSEKKPDNDSPADLCPLTSDLCPKITDFGLARQMDSDSGQTRSGAVMGTPSYMAPEQASGEAHAAGPAADVYALGAILYECLTGRPPFRAATLLETLEQVRSAEPVAPRVLRPDVPRDLETVCLKCLRKEPEQRYGSARELADDLGRFGRGEPVSARPIGAAERLVKWVRRRPAVAGLLAAVCLLAVVGGGLSTYFALEAQAAQTREADERAQRAEEKERAAVEALEKSYAASAQVVLGPLGFQEGPLSSAERDAVWNLAGSDSDRVRLLVFELALEHPDSALRLQRRAELTVQAGIGVDPDRREQLMSLLLSKLRDGDAAPVVRETCAVLGAALDMPEEGFARQACRPLLEAMPRTTDPVALHRLARTVSSLARGLTPAEAARASGEAVKPIRARMAGASDPRVLTPLAQALASLAERLASDEAARTVRPVLDLLARNTQPSARAALDTALTMLTQRLSPDDSATAARHALDLLSASIDRGAVSSLARALATLSVRLAPEGAGTVTLHALDLMAKPTPPASLHALKDALARRTEAVARLVERLTPEDAARAARHVLVLIPKSNSRCTSALAETLSKLAERLTPKAAAAAASEAQLMMLVFPHLEAVPALAEALGKLAQRMPPTEASRLCAVSVQPILDRLGKVGDAETVVPLAQGASILAGRLAPGEAVRVCTPAARALLDRISKTTAPDPLAALGQALAALAGVLTPDEAARTCAKAAQLVLDQAIKTTDTFDRMSLLEALARLTARLESGEAAQMVQRVLDHHARLTDEEEGLAEALPGLAARLSPADAARMAQPILNVMASTSSVQELRYLEEATAKLAERLSPDERARAARHALSLVVKAGTPDSLASLAKSLAGLADGLAPDEAARACATAEQHVLDSMVKRGSSLPYGLFYRANALAKLAERLAPDEAGRAARRALDVLARMTSANAAPSAAALGKAVGNLGERLMPDDLVRTTQHALALVGKASDTGSLRGLADALPALVERLPAGPAGETADALLGLMTSTADPIALAALGRALTKLAPRLAAAQAGRVVPPLLELLARPNQAVTLASLAEALAALATQLRGGPAAATARQAVELLVATADPPRPLMQAVVNVARHCDDAALAELLKHPCCVGVGRDAVRTEWNRRLGQDFAGHWRLAAWLRERRGDLDLGAPARRAVR